MQIKPRFREPVEETGPVTVVCDRVEGVPVTIRVSNAAIAHRLGRPANARLMVEECEDFINANRGAILVAASKKVRRGPVPAEGVTLRPGDF